MSVCKIFVLRRLRSVRVARHGNALVQTLTRPPGERRPSYSNQGSCIPSAPSGRGHELRVQLLRADLTEASATARTPVGIVALPLAVGAARVAFKAEGVAARARLIRRVTAPCRRPTFALATCHGVARCEDHAACQHDAQNGHQHHDLAQRCLHSKSPLASLGRLQT